MNLAPNLIRHQVLPERHLIYPLGKALLSKETEEASDGEGEGAMVGGRPTHSQEHRTAVEALTFLSSDASPESELRGHLPLPHCCGASTAGTPEQRLLS